MEERCKSLLYHLSCITMKDKAARSVKDWEAVWQSLRTSTRPGRTPVHLRASAPLEIPSCLQRIFGVIGEDKVPFLLQFFSPIKGQGMGTGRYVWPPAFVVPGDFADGPDSANLQMTALNAVATLLFAFAKRSVSDLLQTNFKNSLVRQGCNRRRMASGTVFSSALGTAAGF